MKNDALRRFINLRDSLTQERARLESRLREIDNALGQSGSGSSAPAAPREKRAARGGRSRGGSPSLRELVLQVTTARALKKEEILEAIKQAGYKFTTKNPLNSLGTILYGKNPKFKNEDGRFSPASGAARNGNDKGAFARKPRQMSAEARARIAAAQKARWEKARQAKA